MNGGGLAPPRRRRVDVILRHLNVVEHWSARAEQGEFEVDALLIYLAGIPTYSLGAERASCRPQRAFRLNSQPPRRRGRASRRSFSLDYARMHARRGNVAGVLRAIESVELRESQTRRTKGWGRHAHASTAS